MHFFEVFPGVFWVCGDLLGILSAYQSASASLCKRAKFIPDATKVASGQHVACEGNGVNNGKGRFPAAVVIAQLHPASRKVGGGGAVDTGEPMNSVLFPPAWSCDVCPWVPAPTVSHHDFSLR